MPRRKPSAATRRKKRSNLHFRLVLAALCLVAGPGQSAAPPAQAAPTAPAPGPSFEEFLAGVRTEALAHGITEATLDKAFANLQPEAVIIARDRAQPEVVQSLDEYVAQRLTARTIATAREQAARHQNLLSKIEAAYGVPGPVMVAVWGLESNFGKFTGTYQTISALATLAFDARRPVFRTELLRALEIVQTKQMEPAELKGSWAGAMGQPQFMPSSFLKHAVDFDGDKQIDIWTSEADVFGSMANYLRSSGWHEGERWGREVKITRAAMAKIDRSVPMRSSGCRAVRAMTVARALNEWQKLGVRLPGGAPLPSSTIAASLVRGKTRNFLVYRNYDAILDYNCSNSYAVSVGLLSDSIAAK